jgi:flagellar biosynthesis protein FliR
LFLGITEGVIENGIVVFLLVFFRMAALFVVSPIFGRQNIPSYYKIGFSFMLALILVNTLKIQEVSITHIYDFVLLVFKEIMVGLLIGFVAYIIFTSIYLAGQMVDMQVGFGMVSVLDPVTNLQVPVTSNFYFILSMLVFTALNGHHILIRAVFQSYEILPIGQAAFTTQLKSDMLVLFGDIFILGFKIGAPVLAAIILTDVALGILSKTVPQLNVFMVGMPLKILLGIAVIVVTIPMFLNVVEMMIRGMDESVYRFLQDMQPAK